MEMCSILFEMQGFFFFLMLMVLLVSSVPQSAHRTVALKRAPPPPRCQSPHHPHHPDIMDGFYDQQVPFLVPPSVSGHSSLTRLIMALCDWWSSWWTLSVHPCCPAPALMCFHPALSNKQHKSHVEDLSQSRPVNDRKRKFVESELALDTEGNANRSSKIVASARWVPCISIRKAVDDFLLFAFQSCSKISVSYKRFGSQKVSSDHQSVQNDSSWVILL